MHNAYLRDYDTMKSNEEVEESRAACCANCPPPPADQPTGAAAAAAEDEYRHAPAACRFSLFLRYDLQARYASPLLFGRRVSLSLFRCSLCCGDHRPVPYPPLDALFTCPITSYFSFSSSSFFIRIGSFSFVGAFLFGVARETSNYWQAFFFLLSFLACFVITRMLTLSEEKS